MGGPPTQSIGGDLDRIGRARQGDLVLVVPVVVVAYPIRQPVYPPSYEIFPRYARINLTRTRMRATTGGQRVLSQKRSSRGRASLTKWKSCRLLTVNIHVYRFSKYH